MGAGALLSTALWNVDAVVCGLFSARPQLQQRSAVLVEVGIALGRDTPVLLLTREGIQTPALTGLPRIEASLADPETLALKLDLFLQGVSGGVPRKPASTALNLRKPKPSPTSRVNGPALEKAVAEILAGSGSAVLTEVGADFSNVRPDLAFYLEGREADLGLILVEVKQLSSSSDAQRRIRDASFELAHYVAQTNAGLGLVVYDGKSFARQPRTSGSLVAAISLAELRQELTLRPIGDLIGRLRNEAIQGLH